MSGGIHQQRLHTKGSGILILGESEANIRHFHCALNVCSRMNFPKKLSQMKVAMFSTLEDIKAFPKLQGSRSCFLIL